MKAARRILLSSALVAVAIGLLSGCTGDFDSAIRGRDGHVVFEFCDSTEGNVIEVLAVRPGGKQFSRIWMASSRGVGPVPARIDFNGTIDGFASSSRPLTIDGYDK